MELFRHPYYAFVYDARRKLISFNWTAETERMSVDDYQEAIHNFAGFALGNPGSNLLVDLRDFRFQPPASLANWRDDVIAPRYVKAGVKKLVYIAPPGLLERMKSAPDPNKHRRGFAEDYFGSEGEALKWLSS
jgi:hypothetical protein